MGWKDFPVIKLGFQPQSLQGVLIAILAQFLDSPHSMYEITANFLDSKAFSEGNHI